jgi:protein tyrosine kinase modulator
MQPQESTAIARRALDVGDYIDILRRHKGWIFGPLFAGRVVSVVVAFLWPDTYVSIAIVRVVPPQVPENFVPANVNTDVQGRVNSLIQLILNRATLTNIINTHNLYKRDRERLPLDDVIENMRMYDIKCCPLLQTNTQRSERNQYQAFQIGSSRKKSPRT